MMLEFAWHEFLVLLVGGGKIIARPLRHRLVTILGHGINGRSHRQSRHICHAI